MTGWYRRRDRRREPVEAAGWERLGRTLVQVSGQEQVTRWMVEGSAWSEDEAVRVALNFNE